MDKTITLLIKQAMVLSIPLVILKLTQQITNCLDQ